MILQENQSTMQVLSKHLGNINQSLLYKALSNEKLKEIKDLLYSEVIFAKSKISKEVF